MKEFQPIYYEMCKSSKIQDLWVPEIGDYCFNEENLPLLITYVANLYTGLIDLQFIGGRHCSKDSATWLPLQHQLYDILLSHDKSEQHIWSWSRKVTEFCRTFELSHFHGTDWEMCWLAFIEHYLWNREWENGAWIEKDIDHWLQKEARLGTWL